MNERGQSGFTLVEVLVALAILAVSLGVLLHVIGASLDRTRAVRNETIASGLAQSLMAQESVSAQLGERQGEAAGGFRWRIRCEPYGAADDRKAWGSEPVEITVSVSWQDGSRERVRTLTALHIPGES